MMQSDAKIQGCRGRDAGLKLWKDTAEGRYCLKLNDDSLASLW